MVIGKVGYSNLKGSYINEVESSEMKRNHQHKIKNNKIIILPNIEAGLSRFIFSFSVPIVMQSVP